MSARGQRGAFDRSPLRPDRIRVIDGSFAHLSHRFLREGFWATLTHEELLAYVLLVLVADRQGMSFYRDDRIAEILRLVLDDFLAARAGLERKDLVAYDPTGSRTQVLSLPARPVLASLARADRDRTAGAGVPTHIREMIHDFLARSTDGADR
jgi:hypothetical protein